MGEPPITKNRQITSSSGLRTRKEATTSPGVLPSGLEASGSIQAGLLHLTLLLCAEPPSLSSTCVAFVIWMQERSGTEAESTGLSHLDINSGPGLGSGLT